MREAAIDTASIEVLVLSKDQALLQQIESMLLDEQCSTSSSHRVSINHELHPSVEVAIVDDSAIDYKPTSELGALKLKLGKVPIIYITPTIDSAEALSAIKSLTADYIFKANLDGSSLHNCIRWVRHNDRLQKELQQQQRRYESLFYNAVDPSFFLAPNWDITQVNEAFTNAIVLPPDTQGAQPFSSLFANADDFQDIQSRLEQQDFVHFECSMVLPDRKGKFKAEVKVSVLREYVFDQGHPKKQITGYHGSFSNISYKERLRSVKQRADRVDMTYRLARTLAHEIRNPLTNITLALESISDNADLDGGTKKLLALIGRSSGRINELIDHLLSSSERSQVTKETCDMVSLAKEIIEEAKDRAQLVKATIKEDFEEPCYEYPCDSHKLKLAISNLVCNAIESIDGADGVITVGSYVEDGYFHIYVEDNGIGMSDDVQQNLFDPFFTRKDHGVGLGLTATQTIIAEHEGEIEVESKEGYGSTFTIILPLEA